MYAHTYFIFVVKSLFVHIYILTIVSRYVQSAKSIVFVIHFSCCINFRLRSLRDGVPPASDGALEALMTFSFTRLDGVFAVSLPDLCFSSHAV